MKDKLMVVSPYKELGEMIKEISSSFSCEPLIIDGENLDQDFITLLNDLLNNGYNPEVIIGRGVVTTYASKIFTSSSIVRIEPDFIDILYALKKARNYGKKVGILIYMSEEIEENIDFLKNIFDFEDIKIYIFKNINDIEDQIKIAKEEGVDSIIGAGTLGLKTALLHNIPATFIKTSKSCIINAMEQSISIIESSQRRREHLANVTSIINCMNEGLLATKKNEVLLSNSKLDNIMHTSVREYYNKDIKKLNGNIGDFINNKESNNEIIKIDNKNYLLEKLSNKVSFADNIIIFRNVSELQEKEVNVRRKLHANSFSAKYTFKDIIGNDPKMLQTIEKASIYANTDAEILIIGETGTGKELFAQSIHNHSTRKDNPFVAVNCGAIPEQLLESELFGYVEGAFSGAKKGGKVGLFELAHLGTIFLDEIDSLPIMLQGKLLRVIQEKTLRRIGSETETTIDVRILSATNKNISTLMQNNQFRSDLFHRLNTLTISIPNLKDRLDDIELLTNYFIKIYSQKYNKKILSLKQNDINMLKSHSWSGNVRELENLIHRYVILYDQINENELTKDFVISSNDINSININNDDTISIKRGKLENMEHEIIISYLNDYKWNRNEVAEKLGISRSTLWRKLKDE